MQQYRDKYLFVGQGAGFMAVEANAGIFRAFEEHNCVPGYAQTSSGSTMFSSLYYSGHNSAWFKNLMETTEVSDYIKLEPLAIGKTLIGKARHVFNNTNVLKLLEENMTGAASARVKTSLTRIKGRYVTEMVSVTPGRSFGAGCIPFVFRPAVTDELPTLDGGIFNNIPTPSIKEAKKWKRIFVFLAPPSEYSEDGFVNSILNVINAVMDREYEELVASGFFKLPNVTLIQAPSAMSAGLLKWSDGFEFREHMYNLTKEILKDVKLT